MNSQALKSKKEGRFKRFMESTIKWFNNEKGYGFIDNGDAEDIFVHYTEINMDGYKTLKEGERVRFDLVHTPKGLQAHNVTEVSSVNC